MLMDLLALAILGLFAAFGAWRGVLATGAGVVTLVVAYGSAGLGATVFGRAVGAHLGGASMLGPVVAGSGIFVLVFVVLGVFAKILQRWDRGRLGDEPRTACDRIGGAGFGLLRGALVVLLMSVLLTWLDAARDMGLLKGMDGLPDTTHSRVGEATSRVIEHAVEAATDPDEASPGARMMARVAARPGVTLASFQSVMDDPRVQAVQRDRLFWTLVENGAAERAINQASLYSIVHDEEMRTRFAELGLVPPEAAGDPEVFRRTMASTLNEVGPIIASLRNDPELAQLAEDPEIQALVQSGNTLGLMTRPEIQRIVARATASR